MLMAASTSHNSTPSSYASTLHPTKWDVFLSFRGIDTRDSFTDFLYHSLDRKGIRTFRDDPELRSGEVISEALLQAVHNSKIYVVVLSKKYASSRWCLDELVEILGCYRSMDRLVIPVFYYIEPSVAKYQTGNFDEAFRKHENRFDRDRLDAWRVTLKKVGEFSGYHVGENMSQADVINKIVDRVLHEVNPVTLDVPKYPVGLDSRVEEVETLLRNVTAHVSRIGIYGMGGVGKTTLAKVVYNQNYNRFQGSCFLPNVREASKTRSGLVSLQQKLISDVLKYKNVTIDNVDQGIELIRARISSTKILIVIDDLDSKMPLEFLEGTFALGSTIIITTRDEELLDTIPVEAKYKVNELSYVESRQLFCQHAFRGDNRMPDTFNELSKEILKRAGGLPLALKVCGSNLCNQPEETWRWYIDKLRRVSIVDVEKILLISFDSLELVDPMLQHIFLDIVCFFIGHNKEEVVKILETCYTFVNHYINILKKRSLLTVDAIDELRMHDLLLDMGRKIVCNNSPREPGKHSRLWKSKDIYEVLMENEGTEAIEGIIPSHFHLYFEQLFDQEPSITALQRSNFAAETFKRMSKLRFLCLINVNLTGSFENAYKELRWLYWAFCPFKCLPSEFYPQKLVFLALPGSKMRTMWELNTVTVFKKLKTLDMSYSVDLTATTDFTRVPCLETLNLAGCERLEEVHKSIGSLVKLVSLDLQWCTNLKSLPDSICNLTALKSLNIGGCSNLEAIPINLGNIESLAELNAEWLTICELPHSIGRLSKLIELKLSSCFKFKTLSDTICNLRSLKLLDVSWCSGLEALPIELVNLESLVVFKADGLKVTKLPDSIPLIRSLEFLRLRSCSNLLSIEEFPSSLKIINLVRCTAIETLPNLSNLKQLKELNLSGCSGLTELQGLEELTSIQTLHMGGCNSSLLKSTFTKRFFQIYSGFGHRIKIYTPSSVFPDWNSQSPDWVGETSDLGSTVSIDSPPNLLQNFLAMILCSKHSGNEKHGIAVYSVKTTTSDFVLRDNPLSRYLYDGCDDDSCINIVPRTIFSVKDGDDRIEFTASLHFFGDNRTISTEKAKILGIHLLYIPEITTLDECNSTTVNVDEETFFDAVETFEM